MVIDSSYLLIHRMANNKNVYFPNQFFLESISKKSESEEVFFKEYVYDFSVDYNAIDKYDFWKFINI